MIVANNLEMKLYQWLSAAIGNDNYVTDDILPYTLLI